MMGRIFLCCCLFFTGIWTWWSCGDGIPFAISTCQRDSDCAAHQTCIQQFCVSRSFHETNTTTQENNQTSESTEPTEPTESIEPLTSTEDTPEEFVSTDASEIITAETPVESTSSDGGEHTEDPESSDGLCVSGSTMPCYPFSAGKPGVGLCKEGKRTCESDGTWSDCVGAQGPTQETCGADPAQDENCDGIIDEGCPCNYNGSAKGVCPQGIRDNQGKCQPPEQYSAKDVCGDGLDNNCDGTIDDGCQCKAGETRECGINKGICTIGKQSCIDGTWSDCIGAIPPGPVEVCDDNVDNNCNGVVDEGCPCHYLAKTSGVCAEGKRDSQGNCLAPKTYSATEICGDKLDNNCDGSIDEGCPCNYLNLNQGVCKQAMLDSKGNCEAPKAYSTTEICGDKLDNNCDGSVDENCPCSYLGQTSGVCAQGIFDTTGQCQPPASYRAQEICGDGLDNNCDGIIDEGCPCHYLGKNVGVCTTAIVDSTGKCAAPTTYNPQEDCTDNLDNNCDGNVNEGCACVGNVTEPCGINIGACKPGTRTCGRDGKWGPCVGGVNPLPSDVCSNKIDDNCNGSIDENCPCFYKNLPIGVCNNGKIDLAGICQPPPTYKDTEICGDGLDNNCNGIIDEGCPCHYLGKNVGVCANSTVSSNGQCQAPANYYSYERCDGLDNNCNGIIDEGCPCNYLGKTTGVCTTALRDAAGLCLPPSTYRTTELCTDNLDNNCDGAVNEGCSCYYLDKTVGVCRNATRDSKGICQVPAGYSATEQCGDNLDNNCNGIIDENCPCNYLDKTQGVCATAKRNASGICLMPADYNTAELCDGKDNNCNGLIDETIAGTNVPCIIPGKLGECALGTTRCVSNAIKCVAKQTSPLPETCDKKDNDCNGIIDDINTPCYQVLGGYCWVGKETCLTDSNEVTACNVNVSSGILSCTSDATCTSKCPAGHRYKCLPSGGVGSQNVCKVQ